MANIRLLSGLWIFIFLLIGIQFNAAAKTSPLEVELPVLTVMSKMQTQWVAELMVYNGLPMSVRNFKISRSPEDVLHHYESKWKTKGLSLVGRSKAGEFDTLGMMYGDHYYSVQVRKAGSGAEGSLVVSLNPEVIKPARTTEFPLVPGTQILTKIESVDMGVEAETLTLASRRSVPANAEWYKSNLERDGWVLVSYGKPVERRDKILSFQKGAESCQITIVENTMNNHAASKSLLSTDNTMILVNWVKGK